VFAGEHLVGLEEGAGFFVFGVVFFGFLNGFGGELGDGEREVWVCKLLAELGLWELIVDSFWVQGKARR